MSLNNKCDVFCIYYFAYSVYNFSLKVPVLLLSFFSKIKVAGHDLCMFKKLPAAELIQGTAKNGSGE